MNRIHDSIVFGVALGCLWNSCFARPKELDEFYRTWKPLELVRGLRALSVDPFDVFQCLEAVKDLDSEEALDVMKGLEVRPITIYDALTDLGMDPYDAYYALKAWLTDPLLHQPGDHYHRVNVSGDPTHPFLHVVYKKSKKDGYTSSEEYRPRYMTSEEIEKELKAIEEEYKDCLQDEKLKMSQFINKAKAVHSAFDDPAKVFYDFFGDRHFEEWKNTFPEAFEGLKEIYKNPLGFSLRKNDGSGNQTMKHEKAYHHVYKGCEYVKKQDTTFSEDSSDTDESDSSSEFSDPSRYVALVDETHKEKPSPPVPGRKESPMIVHHTKVFYDKLKNMYVERTVTEEHDIEESGVFRRVKSKTNYFSPKDFDEYLKKKNGDQTQNIQFGQQQQPPPHPQQPPPHPQQPPPHPQQPPPQPQQPQPYPQPPPHPQQPPPPHPQQQPPPYPQPPSHQQQQPPPHPQQPPPYPQQPPPHSQQPPPHPQQQPPPHQQQPPPHSQQQPPSHTKQQTKQEQSQQPQKQTPEQQQPQRQQSPPHQTQYGYPLHPPPYPYQQQQPQHPPIYPYQQQQPQGQQPYPQQPPLNFYQHQPPYQQFYNYPTHSYHPQQYQPPPQPHGQYPYSQNPYQQQEKQSPQH